MDKPNFSVILKEMLESNAKGIISNVVKPYAEYYIAKSENKIDDILLPFVDDLEKELLKLADKIDGQVG